ncbi:hypothetical protein L195_g009162 [Trifolium pratense]|uniref:Uncharacterized protein n=1 Tax=Trifolium pratense TaxID=57577 RepID=A0A2K3LZ05_TRIPR|nr:hypothetical protein L195_g036082 [Trifolium pratense]PNX83742.1 hypothetical protein L195_g039790 [Trifolium pratense]PNY12531.1 hypothetical protein L195_g009162 [Trifolium pratense]
MTVLLELTVLSTEGLNNYTSCLNPTIRPFITLTKFPLTTTTTPIMARDNNMFRIPLDPTFFHNASSYLYLQIFTKRRIMGQTQLGWCFIPASDIALLRPGSVQYLSYRLRERDGTRGQVIINISVRLEITTLLSSNMDSCNTVIGIPITAVRRT